MSHCVACQRNSSDFDCLANAGDTAEGSHEALQSLTTLLFRPLMKITTAVPFSTIKAVITKSPFDL